uniref:Malonyl-CoA:ACP transacylase (MAT) domain-containing protein n=1 Tax=Dendroctonus ponderosae TaxID=77166 RepID=A0AAR5P2C7_DENPD
MPAQDMILVKEDVVISGIGGYFPESINIEQFQKNLLDNKDLVGTRWRQGERGVSNKVGTVSTQYFDNAYFGIHRQQCTFMDPMQRLVLESDTVILGPSVAYDANWISGIEVIRLAYDAIRTGQCESVIVGTANLALNAEFQWLYSDMGLLSPDGSTKAFDVDAKGYTRSDGVVVLYIQKASDARRSYASIVNVETLFDGNREGNIQNISVPNMVDFISKFYEKIDVKPEEVEFVETYGCGHKVTDEKELDALERAYCKKRNNLLLIGSVKTNTGHSEASAAMFSIAKVLIAMEQGIIPATIQFENANPNIKGLLNGNLQVVSKNRQWNPKYAAVNALGLNSYYGHLLLKANPQNKRSISEDIPKLVVASTRTEDGIKDILQQFKDKSTDVEFIQLSQDLFAMPILGHLYRGYTLVGADEPKHEVEYHQGTKRPIWFVFSGMGSQWCGMVGDLMKFPTFAAAIDKCHNILQTKGIDLKHIISTSDKTVFDNILHSFVGIAAIQIGLTDILKAVGIVPDGIIGHSVGELGCAYADGCVTAEEMILAAYSRGRASLEAKLIPGMMAAIGVGYNTIKNKLPPTIEVACHNGPDSATLSGPREDMEKFVAELQAQGTFARLVNVSNIAYHSQYIKPAAPYVLKYLKEIIRTPVKRSSKWISTSNLEENWNTELALHSSAEYHTNNLLSSVYFEEGLKHIPKDAILIEIAPHGLLQAILKRSVKSGCTNIPLTQRGSKSAVEFLLTALGKMYLAGMDLSIANIYPRVQYPVGRGTHSLASLVHWNHTEMWRTGLEDKLHSLFSIIDLQVTLNSEEFRECVGHQLDDDIILPCSFYLNIAYQMVANISTERKEIVFENLHFKKTLTIPKIGSVPLHGMVQKGSGEFEISSNKDIIVTGRMTFPQANEKFMVEPNNIKIDGDHVKLLGSDVYSELQHRGHKYSGLFKSIKSLVLSEEGSSTSIQWNNKWTMFLEAMIQQHLFQCGERDQDIFVPKTIQKVCIDQQLLPSEKIDLKVDYIYATKILSTEGLQLIGMEAVTLERETKKMYIDSVEYVPLNNSEYPRMETGICMALELMLA